MDKEQQEDSIKKVKRKPVELAFEYERPNGESVGFRGAYVFNTMTIQDAYNLALNGDKEHHGKLTTICIMADSFEEDTE